MSTADADVIPTKEADAEQIVEWCIEDISTTHWCKGRIAEIKADNGKPKGMGCALGLLALNGGLTRPAHEWEVLSATGRPSKREAKQWEVAVDPRAHAPGVRKELARAIGAVAQATGRTMYVHPEFTDQAQMIHRWGDAIVAHNDSAEMSRQRAVAWFRRALDLLRHDEGEGS